MLSLCVLQAGGSAAREGSRGGHSDPSRPAAVAAGQVRAPSLCVRQAPCQGSGSHAGWFVGSLALCESHTLSDRTQNLAVCVMLPFQACATLQTTFSDRHRLERTNLLVQAYPWRLLHVCVLPPARCAGFSFAEPPVLRAEPVLQPARRCHAARSLHATRWESLS